ncbi:hypothetical protein WA026_018594 [Henosepilachna vigintioctopunctata]|uniref:PDZ domain-containing protein n=1 Tax=Henosepilachna vigintioctopunctata TaxID=420089 RepID=A0AAW1UDZ8_9CUCU
MIIFFEFFWVDDNLKRPESIATFTIPNPSKQEISGIFVKSISKGSAADLTNRIKVNDRIIEVDGVSVVGQTNHQAVEMLKSTGSFVAIKFERYLRGPKYDRLQQAIKANELLPPSPPSPSFSSLPKIPLSRVQMNQLIEPEQDSRTSFDFDSAVFFDNLTPTNEEKEILFYDARSTESHEILREKWQEKVGKETEIVIAEMMKDVSSGLGISLEGTVDVEDGKEVRPHHYIRNILPDGPVGKNGVLRPGDELLEVNGIHLLGLNHLEVVTILKQLPVDVKMVCARYSTPTRIIDTAQHREAFQARKILAGSLQTLIPVNDRLVKAKSETSLASNSVSEVLSSEGRSKSFEMFGGLPMWKSETTVVELTKGDHGLGFSILDYQDPLNPHDTVIVIRSLVPGGMAQADGRLIPGDRLMAVNDVDVERATLDRAVQILKSVPRGPVRITVAKPITSNDTTSHSSQDTDDDQTCLEEFQECLEEYQECLEVMHICVEDDRSFNTSSCNSQTEDLRLNESAQIELTSAKDSKDLLINRSSIDESDLDVSYKSTNNTKSIQSSKTFSNINPSLVSNHLQRGDSQNTQSDKVSSEKDEYETCMEESLSEDNKKVKVYQKNILESKQKGNSMKYENMDNIHQYEGEFLQVLISDTLNKYEPKVNGVNNKISFQQILDEGLKCYDNSLYNDGADEFFLVQYPAEAAQSVKKSYSDSNVLESNIIIENQVTYRKCLKEYYNDIQDCMEAFREAMQHVEMTDDDIFNNINLPFKCKSAPDIMDSSFVMVTYDPGPDINRRKSAFEAGQDSKNEGSQMTILRGNTKKSMKGRAPSIPALQRHWGSTHNVKVFREPNSSLGISIVGGKVDLRAQNNSGNATLGIFVKSIVPNSPAGKSGQFKTGDRILQVNGVSLDHTSHEDAVNIIRNASNPVTFVIQSLIPWIENDDSFKSNGPSSVPSPVSTNIPNTFSEEMFQNSFKNEMHANENVDENSDYGFSTIQPSGPPSIAVTPEPRDIENKSANPLQNAHTTTYSSESEDEDEDDVRLMEGRTISAAGVQIDRASAGNVKRSKEEIANDPEKEDDFGYTMSEFDV